MIDTVFDTVSGLPVHILVVHGAVVLIPLMFLVTLAFTVRPRWRGGLGWAVLGNLVAVAIAFAARESGEKLQARLSQQAGQTVAARHGDLGRNLPWFALAMLIAAVVSWLLLRRSARNRPSAQSWEEAPRRAPRASTLSVVVATVLVLAAGGAATGWTVRVGDSGSRAAWADTIANTRAP